MNSKIKLTFEYILALLENILFSIEREGLDDRANPGN